MWKTKQKKLASENQRRLHQSIALSLAKIYQYTNITGHTAHNSKQDTGNDLKVGESCVKGTNEVPEINDCSRGRGLTHEDGMSSWVSVGMIQPPSTPTSKPRVLWRGKNSKVSKHPLKCDLCMPISEPRGSLGPSLLHIFVFFVGFWLSLILWEFVVNYLFLRV